MRLAARNGRMVALAVTALLSSVWAIDLDSVVANLTASLDRINTYQADACITECG